MRTVNTLNVSKIGIISRANVSNVAPPVPEMILLILLEMAIFFMNTIHSVAKENPKIKEPVSPMKIRAGAQLNFKKPNTAPNNVMLIIASL